MNLNNPFKYNPKTQFILRAIFILGMVLLQLTGCRSKIAVRPVQKMKIEMGTFVQISIYDEDKSIDYVQQAIDRSFHEIERIDKMASNWTDDSEVALINEKASTDTITINPELAYIIEKALYVGKISNGAFDITVSPLIKLWNVTDTMATILSHDDIVNAMKKIGYVYVSLKNNKLVFSQNDISIDLGGIAKGYAVDQGIKVLIEAGITDALINAGGDFTALCSPLTAGKRKVWIKHPRQRDQLFGYFKMDNGSVATSGDYERYFEVDSVRYHHIIDPATGYPANKSVSVTIQAKSALMADALATAVFVMGPEAGMKLVNSLDGVEGVIIYFQNKKLEYIVSDGLRGKFIKS